MYETVLNHTYAGKLEKETSDDAVENPNDFGKWENAKTTHLVYKIESDGHDPVIITNTTGNDEGNHAEEKLIQRLIRNGTGTKTNDSCTTSDFIVNFTKMSVKEKERKKESKTEDTR